MYTSHDARVRSGAHEAAKRWSDLEAAVEVLRVQLM